MKYDLVIKNAYIYIDKLIVKKDIAIKNGIIIKIANKIKSDFNIIDAKENIILPGFINTHIHFGEYYVKGYNKKLNTKEYICHTERFNDLNEESKELIRLSSSKISAYEAIKYGQTTLMGIRGWNSIEDFNVRLYMGYPLMKSNKLKEYTYNFTKKFETFKDTKLNTYYIFIHSLLTVDEKILKEVSEYLKNKNLFLAIHLKETKNEEKLIKEKYKLNSLQVLEKYGLLTKNTLLVHCCYLNKDDINIIKKYNCTITINPNSNLKLKNKILDITKISDINICVGTDGVATNDSLNILDSVKTLGLFKNVSGDDLIDMITSNPGKFLNNKTGKIKEGYKADLIIYDLNNYKINRKETFINNLIYSSEIVPKYVIVDGRYIVKDYENVIYNINDINKMNISNELHYLD